MTARQAQASSKDDFTAVYLDYECLLFCLTQVAWEIKPEEVAQMKDAIQLI